jgi:putative tricarboxylic transport membrane protein
MGNGLVRNGEVISGAVLAALGVYIFLQSRAWDYYTADGPGPGFFPTWYGVAMVALSVALIVNNLARPKSAAESATTPARAVDWRAARRALGTWLAFAVAVALMWPLGFVVSFALFTFVIVAFVFRRPLRTAGVTAVAVSLVFYLIFPVTLDVQLPTGVFGF